MGGLGAFWWDVGGSLGGLACRWEVLRGILEVSRGVLEGSWGILGGSWGKMKRNEATKRHKNERK